MMSSEKESKISKSSRPKSKGASGGNSNDTDRFFTTKESKPPVISPSEGFVISDDVLGSGSTKRSKKRPKSSGKSKEKSNNADSGSGSKKTASPVESQSRPASSADGGGGASTKSSKKSPKKDDNDGVSVASKRPKTEAGAEGSVTSNQKKLDVTASDAASSSKRSNKSKREKKENKDTTANNNNGPAESKEGQPSPSEVKTCPEGFQPLFSYGNNNNANDSGAGGAPATPACYINLAEIFPSAGNNCTNNCHWWKARSVECSKCQVQALVKRPRPTTGGYGPKRENEGGGQKSGTSTAQVPRDVQAFANKGRKNSSLNKEQDDEESNRRKKRDIGRSNDCGPTSQYLSETQAQFGPPHLQKKFKGQRITEKKEETIRKMREFMKVRPPWNHDTNVPDPPYVDSLAATEAKVKELEKIEPPSTNDNNNDPKNSDSSDTD